MIAVINGITRHAKELEMKLTICYQIANTYGIVFAVHYPITQMVYLSHWIHYQTQMFDSHHLDISTYSDIIDQPQATKPTIHVNKKQKVAKKKASQMPYNIKYKLSISEV